MKDYLVGSALHGDLLNPADIDIYVETDSIEEFLGRALKHSLEHDHTDSKAVLLNADDYKSGAKFFLSRTGEKNFIISYKISVKEFTDRIDVSILRGFKDLETGEIKLSEEAIKDLENKILRIDHSVNGHLKEIFYRKYAGNAPLKHQPAGRAHQYLDKLPSGWTFQSSSIK